MHIELGLILLMYLGLWRGGMSRRVYSLSCGIVFLLGCPSDVGICGTHRVCGVDDKTYENYCAANAAGMEIAYLGPCQQDCDDIECEIACIYGFDHGDDGCPLCECAPPPLCANNDPCLNGDECVDGRCGVPGPDVKRDSGIHDSGIHDSGIHDSGTDRGLIDTGIDAGIDASPRDAGSDSDASDASDASDVGVYDADAASCDIGTPSHCGACGVTCPDGARCASSVDGGFHCQCPAWSPHVCNDQCVNLSNDSRHCELCGSRCLDGQICAGGECVEDTNQCTVPGNWECTITGTACMTQCGTDSCEIDPDKDILRCGGTECPIALGPDILSRFNCEICTSIASHCLSLF